MEFNKLPEDYDAEKNGSQKRRIDFANEQDKLAYDVKGLIVKAEKQFQRTKLKVEPVIFAQRADDDIEALRLAIAKEQGKVNPTIVAPEIADTVEVDPRLARYKEQYNGSGNPKLKAVSWSTIQARMLEDESFQLRAALDLEQGGELFGIDKEGNPLISDGGDEPVMKGMNYPDTCARVRFKHTSKTTKQVR